MTSEREVARMVTRFCTAHHSMRLRPEQATHRSPGLPASMSSNQQPGFWLY